MKYLLDTQIIIWYFEDNKKLPTHIRNIIEDPDNMLYVCWISLWEVAIKRNIGKLITEMSIDELYELISEGPINLINIDLNQLNHYINLPYLHGDPYDRLLISTAISENLKFITADKDIHNYKQIECIWKE